MMNYNKQVSKGSQRRANYRSIGDSCSRSRGGSTGSRNSSIDRMDSGWGSRGSYSIESIEQKSDPAFAIITQEASTEDVKKGSPSEISSFPPADIPVADTTPSFPVDIPVSTLLPGAPVTSPYDVTSSSRVATLDVMPLSSPEDARLRSPFEKNIDSFCPLLQRMESLESAPTQHVESLETVPIQHVMTSPTQHVKSVPTQHVKTAPIQHVMTSPTQHVKSAPTQHVKSAPIQHVMTSPTQHVKSAPIQHVKSAPIQHVKSAPIQHVETVPTQHVKSAPIQHVKSAPIQHVKTAPIQHVETVPIQHMDILETAPIQQVKTAPIQHVQMVPTRQLETAPIQPPAPAPQQPHVVKRDVLKKNSLVIATSEAAVISSAIDNKTLTCVKCLAPCKGSRFCGNCGHRFGLPTHMMVPPIPSPAKVVLYPTSTPAA